MNDSPSPEDEAVVAMILDAEAHPERYHCIHCGKAFNEESEVWVKQDTVTRVPLFAHVACEIRWRRRQGMPPPRAQAIVQKRPKDQK